MRILVCGAGPTGLTLAMELTRRGIAVDVVEKRGAPSKLSRAVGILPGSMEILEASGVAEQVRRSAISIERAEVHHEGDLLATLDLGALSDPHQRLFALPQDHTERLLRNALEGLGGRVQYGTRVEGLECRENGEIVVTINGEAVHYDYVVGCDGVHSLVRQALGIAYDGFEIDGKWSIADVDVEGWQANDCFSIFLLDGGNAVIVVPLDTVRMRVIASTEDAVAALPVPMRVKNVRRSGAFTISVRIAKHYQKGSVFIAGDAAHCHSPAGGRGMNLGIADAADLARRFAEGDLDNYSHVRRAEGEQVVAFSERARGMVMSQNWLKRQLLFKTMRLVDRVPALNRLIVRRLLDF